MCHNTCLEVSGQLAKIVSSLLLCRSWGLNSCYQACQVPLAVEHWNKMETSSGSIRDTCNSCRLLPPSPVLYWMLMLHPDQTLWLFSSLPPLLIKACNCFVSLSIIIYPHTQSCPTSVCLCCSFTLLLLKGSGGTHPVYLSCSILCCTR